MSEFLVDELHVLLYPLTLGKGKRVWDENTHSGLKLRSATPYPTGLGRVEERLDALEQRVDKCALRSELAAFQARLDNLQQQVRTLEARLDD